MEEGDDVLALALLYADGSALKSMVRVQLRVHFRRRHGASRIRTKPNILKACYQVSFLVNLSLQRLNILSALFARENDVVGRETPHLPAEILHGGAWAIPIGVTPCSWRLWSRGIDWLVQPTSSQTLKTAAKPARCFKLFMAF